MSYSEAGFRDNIAINNMDSNIIGGDVLSGDVINEDAISEDVISNDSISLEKSANTKKNNSVTSPVILVVEDDNDLREALADTLELADFRVVQADSAEVAITVLSRLKVDMVVSDVNMGDMNGHQLLDHIKENYPFIPALLVTAYASVSDSVDAIRHGAVDYLVKPFEPEKLVDIVKRYALGCTSQQIEAEPVAEDPVSKELLELALRVAKTDSTVLVSGESGTGKEVLARYIHSHSNRSEGPFVAINCAAIPESMLEATLFGHEKGAFTGAYNSTPGKFELANGGTILLDEISEMDVGLQAKLLRVLQEREVERVGARKSIALDVRVIATTNRQLLKEVLEGKFREDLYYRLSVFPLEWSALRERPKDILPLANRLLKSYALKMHRRGVIFNESAQRALLSHDWPGNVRELDNVVQRALIMQPQSEISDKHLRIQPLESQAVNTRSINLDIDAEGVGGFDQSSNVNSAHKKGVVAESQDVDLGDNLKKKEFSIIIETLRVERGSRKNTAEKLGISPRTLRYKLARMREFGIDIDAALSL